LIKIFRYFGLYGLHEIPPLSKNGVFIDSNTNGCLRQVGSVESAGLRPVQGSKRLWRVQGRFAAFGGTWGRCSLIQLMVRNAIYPTAQSTTRKLPLRGAAARRSGDVGTLFTNSTYGS
jgi:hypothetical protein